MGLEIERRFLLDKVPDEAILFSNITQGYLSTDKDRTVRIRLEESRVGDVAYITIKSPAEGLFSRHEFEYPIPIEDAKAMIAFCIQPIIKKSRFTFGSWEIDAFTDRLEGLVIAEIELDSEYQGFEMPIWATYEITGIAEYTNAGLVEKLRSET